ncbi:MAG: hypothetical protein U5R48_04435 [Gammaproteobacteria bacterium]|nr:hypothetical protein [Gammaproteobacteria bacterium]
MRRAEEAVDMDAGWIASGKRVRIEQPRIRPPELDARSGRG